MRATIQEAERALSYDIRTVAMREAIDQVKAAANVLRVATHRLIGADLQGAVDVASHALYEVHKANDILEGQYRDLLGVNPAQSRERVAGHPRPLEETHGSSLDLTSVHQRGRRRGLDIVPGSVRAARMEAGLSLAQVAGRQVTRVAIWHVETGRSRPSLETLQLIADRTGKSLDFFLPKDFA